MALGLGEGGEQTAPLGRAVIGGLVGSTLATLLVLPAIYTLIQGRSPHTSASLDPEDPNSRFFEVRDKPSLARTKGNESAGANGGEANAAPAPDNVTA